jgi:acyl dehydratase
MHRPIARNFAAASENRIHSDEIAQRLGFTGALVPGVTVFGHLTWPLTSEFGSAWLSKSVVNTRFLKPAYHGETLAIAHRTHGAVTEVEARNDAGVLLATLDCATDSLPPVDAHSTISGTKDPDARVPIEWESVRVEEPFARFVWTPDDAHNREYADRLDDRTRIFAAGVLHPHAILAQANQVLVRRYVMPAWIHTGSEIRFRSLLRAGDQIEIRAVPVERWEKKGHQFIKVYIAYVRDGEVTTEIFHTAIFRIAGIA